MAGSDTSGSRSARTSLDQYLSAIGRVALLTKEQERELGSRIMAGIDSARTLAARDVTGRERAALERLVAEGLTAERAMVEANLRLVVLFAKKWHRTGVPLEDLIQEGNLGLLRAVQRFDWRKGFKFSTYAAWWIRQAMGKGEQRLANTIYLPADVAQLSADLRGLDVEREGVAGAAPPTVAHYAAQTGKSEKLVRVALAQRRSMISLDGETATGRPVAEVVTDDSPSALERLVHDENAQVLQGALGRLSEQQRIVVIERFGLDGAGPRTQQVVATALGLSAQKVRGLEAEAVSVLRGELLDQ